jgi:hypothetical protein
LLFQRISSRDSYDKQTSKKMIKSERSAHYNEDNVTLSITSLSGRNNQCENLIQNSKSNDIKNHILIDNDEKVISVSSNTGQKEAKGSKQHSNSSEKELENSISEEYIYEVESPVSTNYDLDEEILNNKRDSFEDESVSTSPNKFLGFLKRFQIT